MSVDDVKNALKDMMTNSDTSAQDADVIDKLLLEVVKIEKRHLYGLDSTSSKKRRDEIANYLNSEYSKMSKKNNAT